MLRWTRTMCVGAMLSASSKNSLFPPTWCPSSPCVLMTFVLTGRHGGSTSEKVWQHIGESLFEYVKQQAKELGCYEVTLNVWAGNTPAEHFYEKMGMKTKERQMEYIL